MNVDLPQQNYILYSGASREKRIGKIEDPTPLNDIGFLRQELQEACIDKPVHMAESIDLTEEKGDYVLLRSWSYIGS